MKKRAFLFLTGGTVYPTLEIAARGHTDFSMAVAGGLCLCLIDRICNNRIKDEPIYIRCAAGSAIITSVEFIIGVIVNIALKMNVWDYSSMPLNILGQVCLPFSLLWFVATIPAMGLCKLCDRSSFLTSN